MCETQICEQPRRTDVHSVVLRLSPRPLVMKVGWVVKQTNPLTHRSSLDAGRQTPLATTDPGIGPDTSLADGSEAVSPTLGQRRQEQGVKNAVLLPPPPPHPQTPCLGLQKQHRLPQCTLPSCLALRLLQTGQEFRLGAVFFYCLALDSQCSPSDFTVLRSQRS